MCIYEQKKKNCYYFSFGELLFFAHIIGIRKASIQYKAKISRGGVGDSSNASPSGPPMAGSFGKA